MAVDVETFVKLSPAVEVAASGNFTNGQTSYDVSASVHANTTRILLGCTILFYDVPTAFAWYLQPNVASGQDNFDWQTHLSAKCRGIVPATGANNQTVQDPQATFQVTLPYDAAADDPGFTETRAYTPDFPGFTSPVYRILLLGYWKTVSVEEPA